MPYSASKKQTFLKPSGPHYEPSRLHLFILLTDACHSGAHLMAPVCTIRDNKFYDQACIIEPGEHGFITAKSSVEYRLAVIAQGGHIALCVDGGIYIEKENVNDDLFNRICSGARTSTHITRSMQNYFLNWPRG